MNNKKSTKRALFSSVLSLVLCMAMLIGSTFAWFTDSVTSGNNIIKSGTLDVAMEWANGKEDPATATWTDASTGPIFNNDLWEPGYTEARHIKITNKGTLAMNWTLAIAPNGNVSALADVIDVYLYGAGELSALNARQVADRESLAGFEYVGTLSEVINAGIASGRLYAEEDATVIDHHKEDSMTIVLKTREDAGNEYQDLSIGADFDVQLLATQLTYESDSFDNQYDVAAGKTVVTPETAQAAIWAAEEGDVIYLDHGNYGALVIENEDGTPKKGITIEHDKPQTSYQEPLTVASINLNGSENITIRGIFFAADQAERVYSKKSGATNYYASIVGSKEGGNTGAKNIVIDNCRFKNDGAYWAESTVNSDNYVPVCFEEQGRPTSRATNITVMNCYVDIEVFNFVRANYLAAGSITIKGNNVIQATKHSVMNFTGNAASIYVRDNSFKGWNPEKAMIGTSWQAGKPSIEVTGNIIAPRAALTGEGVVLDIKPTYTKDNCTIVFEGNTFSGALAGQTEATVPCNLPN